MSEELTMDIQTFDQWLRANRNPYFDEAFDAYRELEDEPEADRDTFATWLAERLHGDRYDSDPRV